MARTFTLRGQSPAAATHTKLRVSQYDPTVQFQVVEFKIMPAEASTTEGSDCSGILTINENAILDPSDADFSDQGQIAWAKYTRYLSEGAPAPGVDKSPIITQHDIVDSKWFNYNLWVHTEDAMLNSAVNWFIRILKVETSEVAGSISSMRQYALSRT